MDEDAKLVVAGSTGSESGAVFTPRAVSAKALKGIEEVAEEVGGAYKPLPEAEGAVAFTHFDSPASEDNSVTILLIKENMDALPSQALVRIKSLKEDGKIDRVYLAVVVAGPFAERDGLRADSPIVVTTTVQGRILSLPSHRNLKKTVGNLQKTCHTAGE